MRWRRRCRVVENANEHPSACGVGRRAAVLARSMAQLFSRRRLGGQRLLVLFDKEPIDKAEGTLERQMHAYEGPDIEQEHHEQRAEHQHVCAHGFNLMVRGRRDEGAGAIVVVQCAGAEAIVCRIRDSY